MKRTECSCCECVYNRAAGSKVMAYVSFRGQEEMQRNIGMQRVAFQANWSCRPQRHMGLPERPSFWCPFQVTGRYVNFLLSIALAGCSKHLQTSKRRSSDRTVTWTRKRQQWGNVVMKKMRWLVSIKENCVFRENPHCSSEKGVTQWGP